MSSDELKYYENLVDMFLTTGWKQYVEEVEMRLNQLNIDNIGTLEALYKAKGEKEVLTSILGFESLVRNAMDEITNAT